MRSLRTSILALGCALAVIAPTLAPALAGADGDPASDTLLGENVFYPYSPSVSASLQHTLDAATAAARRSGFPIRVALIASPVDLGVIPDLFGQPQKYADFLDQEISFKAKQPLLVVMAAGYGTQGLDAHSQAVVAALPRPAGGSSDQLATAAIHAVATLAAAAGHPLTGVPGVASSAGSGGGGGSGVATILIILSAVVVVLAAAGLIVTRRRRSPMSPGDTPAAEQP